MFNLAPRIDYAMAADGYRFAVRVWEAEHPRVRMIWLHGVMSHGGWYLGSCRCLARAGVEVHFLDRRGSGLNPVGRGDVDSFETWLEDVEGYLETLPADLPVVLTGISWGGKLATAVARRNRRLIEGLALLCPGLFAQKGPGRGGLFAVHALAALGLTRLRVPIPLGDPALFADAPAWRDYVAADPLALRKVSIRFALADQELGRYAVEAPEKIRVPVLLMLAGRDQIIDNRRVEDFVRRVASTDRQVLTYPQAAHTFDFDPEYARIYQDLARWAVEKG